MRMLCSVLVSEADVRVRVLPSSVETRQPCARILLTKVIVFLLCQHSQLSIGNGSSSFLACDRTDGLLVGPQHARMASVHGSEQRTALSWALHWLT